MLPRALRIPGIKSRPEEALHFSSRRSKWLDDNILVEGKGGKITNWKKQYKLRHNWSIGACEVQEIHVADRPPVPEMLVKLAEGVVVTVDKEDGLRAWDLKEKRVIARCDLSQDLVPTCLAVDEHESSNGLGIAIGFVDGGWGVWRLDAKEGRFVEGYRHPRSSNGSLSAIAFAGNYVLTMTESQLLSLYSFGAAPEEAKETSETHEGENSEIQQKDIPVSTEHFPPSSELEELQAPPRLLASLTSHTSWPPLSLSIRTTTSSLIASIAYSLPTYLSGYTIGLQELHLSPSTGLITFSRLTSALPQGFTSLLPSPPSPSSTSLSQSSSLSLQNMANQNPVPGSRPTSLTYSHPYILATHPDNTLTLYLCTSTSSSLSITPGTKLWGHTSSISSASITPRGKAVSVSTRGNELRVWELEGRLSRANVAPPMDGFLGPKANAKGKGRSVVVRPEIRRRVEKGEEEGNVDRGLPMEIGQKKQWVGFDDEMVIVLKESEGGTQALVVYDFS